MSTLEFHVITPEGVAHVCDVHRGPSDQSPLQIISLQELARLRAVEAELLALRAVSLTTSPIQHSIVDF